MGDPSGIIQTGIVQRIKDSATHFFTGPHKNLRISFLITLTAILITNFPALISFLPKNLQSDVQTGCYIIIQGAVLAALVWAKQWNAVGAPGQAVPPPVPAPPTVATVDTEVGYATNFVEPNRFDVDHKAGTPDIIVGTLLVVGDSVYTVVLCNVISPLSARADRYCQLTVSPVLPFDPKGLSVFVRQPSSLPPTV